MNLEKFIAVSGLPGLYKLAGNRSNGLLLKDMVTEKTKFVSSRKHQFTPLESVAIYTDDGESIELKKVFQNMLDQLDNNPPVNVKGKSEELHEYFADILPNYDRDNVYTRDIQKVIKWFNFLNERDLLSLEDEKTTEEE